MNIRFQDNLISTAIAHGEAVIIDTPSSRKWLCITNNMHEIKFKTNLSCTDETICNDVSENQMSVLAGGKSLSVTLRPGQTVIVGDPFSEKRWYIQVKGWELDVREVKNTTGEPFSEEEFHDEEDRINPA